MSTDNSGILQEILEHKLDTVLEVLNGIKVNTDTIPELHERIAEVEIHLDTLKVAVTSTNNDVIQLDTRVLKLEQA